MNTRCTNCNTRWHTKKTFDMHMAMCSLIHKSTKDREIDQEIVMPSATAMFQYILHLTNKIENLETKVAKIQTVERKTRRQHIEQYLKSIEKPAYSFNDWISSIEVTEQHLERVLEKNLVEGIQYVLTPLLADIPIRAFVQRPSTFYVYDNEWRIMEAAEFKKIVDSISHKMMKTYVKWSKERGLLMSMDTQETAMTYMQKVKGGSLDTRTGIIKKWAFSKMAVSLTDVDF